MLQLLFENKNKWNNKLKICFISIMSQNTKHLAEVEVSVQSVSSLSLIFSTWRPIVLSSYIQSLSPGKRCCSNRIALGSKWMFNSRKDPENSDSTLKEFQDNDSVVTQSSWSKGISETKLKL